MTELEATKKAYKTLQEEVDQHRRDIIKFKFKLVDRLKAISETNADVYYYKNSILEIIPKIMEFK